MISKMLNIFNSIDENNKKLIKKGLRFCYLLAITSIITLLIYQLIYSSISLYYIGFYLFKNSILFGCAFFVFGLAFDRIKKEIY